MQREPLRVAGLLAVGLLATASATSAAPPAATDGEEHGLLVLLEAWFVTPRNAELDYAFVGAGSLAGGGEVVSLSHDNELVPRFYAGWRFGEAGETQLGMTFWEYDDSVEGSVPPDPMNVGPLLASPAFLAFSKVDSADASSRLRATVVDSGVRWRHRLGERGSLRIDVELRLFRYERVVQVQYRRDFGQLRELFINAATDAQGLGPRVALGYAHAFGSRFSVGGQLGLALPVGTLEYEERQEFLVDGSFDSATAAVEPGTRRAFLQIEAELELEVRLAGGLTGSLSYAFQQWTGVERGQRLIDVAAQSAAATVDRDVVFEGFLLGLRYAF